MDGQTRPPPSAKQAPDAAREAGQSDVQQALGPMQQHLAALRGSLRHAGQGIAQQLAEAARRIDEHEQALRAGVAAAAGPAPAHQGFKF